MAGPYPGESQSDAFGQGVDHVRNADIDNSSNSLTLNSARWDNDVRGQAATPHSVLDTLSFAGPGRQSANGTSGAHWQGGMGVLGNANGLSHGQYEAATNLKFNGHNEDVDLG